MSLYTEIFVTFSFEGEHCYPDAPDEVSYLRNVHRHLFNVRVDIDVEHDEREIEFHMFKHELQSRFRSYEDCSNKSCETMARELAGYLLANYHGRDFSVTVDEDGENGAIVTHIKDF